MKIENEEQYQDARAKLRSLLMAPLGTPRGDAMELSVAIGEYERERREEIYQQALDEAILGLHGMNKDFPNETWESRQAYLDATIAGINNTLSLLK